MKYIRYILFTLLFLIFFLGYQGLLSHVIFYHEQHHLFLFSKAYFHKTLLSEGILGYATNFVIQFFYNPVVGSLLLSLILASIFLLTSTLIRRIIGRNELLFLSVLPALMLFFYSMRIDHSLKVIIATFISLLVVNLIVWLLFKIFKIRSRYIFWQPMGTYLQLIIVALALVIYTGVGYRHFIKNYNVNEHLMVKVDQYSKQRDWDKVLKYTEKYLQRGRSNHLISTFHNMALYHKGSLPYKLFDYPQALGVKSLYFPWESNSRESEYGYLLYEELGYINEAHRWEFEAMVVWGETAPHLINLARYNLANNRPLVAQRFINLLNQSLFYSGDALEKHLQPLPNNALAHVDEESARFANVVNIGPELQYLLDNDPQNRMAFEYLMSHLLLSNHVERFVENLKYLNNFSYPHMPPIYEEALYIYELGVEPKKFAELGYTVSEETKRRFEHYYTLVKNQQMDQLQREFGNSYWFYLNYVSPYGSKVISN